MKTSMLKVILDCHKYLMFLILFAAFVTTSAYWLEDSFISWGLEMFFLMVIFSLVRALPFHRKIMKPFLFWIIIAALLKTWVFIQYSITSQLIANFAMLVIYLMLIVHILKDIYLHKEVTQELIFAAICVYMIIGVAFGNIYIQMDHFIDNAFDFRQADISLVFEREFNILYYSFTTLTTVGFGDIVPNNIAVKGVTILEQMTGVLYLAVLVSRLVSSFSNHRH